MPTSRRIAFDGPHVVGQLDAVDDDVPGLVPLEGVDAADHRRLAGAGRAADDDPLAAADVSVMSLEDVEDAVPLVDVIEADRRAAWAGGGAADGARGVLS